MNMPSKAAMDIVDRFSWSSNVMRDGRLIGQQYVVAEAIDEALSAKDAEIERLRAEAAVIGRQRRRLLSAGRKVLKHLLARIDSAPTTAKPVFVGIADLHGAVNAATAKRGRRNHVR